MSRAVSEKSGPQPTTYTLFNLIQYNINGCFCISHPLHNVFLKIYTQINNFNLLIAYCTVSQYLFYMKILKNIQKYIQYHNL